MPDEVFAPEICPECEKGFKLGEKVLVRVRTDAFGAEIKRLYHIDCFMPRFEYFYEKLGMFLEEMRAAKKYNE